MQFKTHQRNLTQLKGAIKAWGAAWFHGDGNIYRADKPEFEKKSDDRKNYANPTSEEATYRKKFTSIDQVPSSIEAMNQLLMAEKNKQTLAENLPSNTNLGHDNFTEFEEDENPPIKFPGNESVSTVVPFVELTPEEFAALSPTEKTKYTKAKNKAAAEALGIAASNPPPEQ